MLMKKTKDLMKLLKKQRINLLTKAKNILLAKADLTEVNLARAESVPAAMKKKPKLIIQMHWM